MDLTELLLQPEGKTLDFKRDLSSPAGVVSNVVAFANTSGGTVLIGVNLDTLRLTVRHQGRAVPTIGGVLLFGRDRLAHFPGAWVQAGRFAGTDRSRIVDQTEIVSHPSEAVSEAVTFIEKHGLHGARIGAVRRSSVRSLPPVAVREALVNALVHADYAQRGAPLRVALFDDRLEIENPGLLPFGVTLDDLPRGVSKLRNRVLGRTFKELGLVEQWGSGVQRMIGACREAGLPPPEWAEIGTRLRVTLRTGPGGTVALDPKDRDVLDALGASDGLRTREVADAVGLSARATRQRLARLVELGEVREIGSGPNDPQRRYFRVDN